MTTAIATCDCCTERRPAALVEGTWLCQACLAATVSLGLLDRRRRALEAERERARKTKEGT